MRLLIPLLAIWASTASAAGRLNVVLILSDDLRPQLGCYGDPQVKSPHLDRFAREAMRFDRAYVQCAICSPSRNSFLSGLRPNTTGLRGFGRTIREAVPDVVTLPQYFKNHGYHTAAIGKVFHLYAETGLGGEDDPISWSQPLTLPQRPVWGPDQERVRQRLIAEAKGRGVEFKHSHDWPRPDAWDAPDVADDELQDGEIASRAIEVLRQQAKQPDRPFFVAVGFLKPHLPYVAPKKYWGLYRSDELKLPTNQFPPHNAPPWSVFNWPDRLFANVPKTGPIDEAFKRTFLHGYLASISYMDAQAGRVVDAVKELGLRDRTVIVFLGDNGYQVGEHNSWGHKHTDYETSTRVPLLVSAPGMRAAGQSTRALVELLDLYPTLADLCRLPPPGRVEGTSFAPLLDEPSQPWKPAAFSEMQRADKLGRTIRTDRYRYVEWTGPAGRVLARELYDHQVDPDENENVAAAGDKALIESLSTTLAKTLPVVSQQRQPTASKR